MRLLLILMTAGTLSAQSAAPPAKPAAPVAAKKLGAASTAGGADPVVFTAGSTKLTRSEFDLLMKIVPVDLRGQIGENTPKTRRLLAERFGDVVLFASEAKKRKLDARPETRLKLLFQEQSLLAGVLYQYFLDSSKPTEAEAQAWYQLHKADYEQASARNILIRFKGSRVPLKPNQVDLSEADALVKASALRERIVKGEDFAAVALAESDDPGTAAKGGDLGRFGRKEMVPELEQAAFTLPLGEVSQPVRSAAGFHLIQVQERRTRDFAETRAEIEQRLQAENAQKAMKELKKSFSPILDEGYFGQAVASGRP